MGMDSRGSSGDDIDLYEAKYPDNNVPTFLQRPLDFFNNNNNNNNNGSQSTNSKSVLEPAVRSTRSTIRFRDEVSVSLNDNTLNNNFPEVLNRNQPNVASDINRTQTINSNRAIQPNLSPLKISSTTNNNNISIPSGRSRTPMSQHFISKASNPNPNPNPSGSQSRARDDQGINIRSPNNFNSSNKPKKDGKASTSTTTTAPVHAGTFLSNLKLQQPLQLQPQILKPVAVRPGKGSSQYSGSDFNEPDMASFAPVNPNLSSNMNSTSAAIRGTTSSSTNNGSTSHSSSNGSTANNTNPTSSNAYHPGKSTRPHHVGFAKGKFSQTNIMVAK